MDHKNIILKMGVASRFIILCVPSLFVVMVIVIAITLKCVWEKDETAGVGSFTVPPSGW